MIEVGYERRDRIAFITLNRPEAKNASPSLTAMPYETSHGMLGAQRSKRERHRRVEQFGPP
jgi:enoyl-CoA hydratase/carnithine racemase